MSISEQVKELREVAEMYDGLDGGDILQEASDTIESLSAKLHAANMEQSAEDSGKSVLKIDTPKVCIDCPCHFAGGSGMVVCGVEKRELLSDDIQTFKPDWCPLRESDEDCGGWIPCSDPPKHTNEVLVFNGKSYSVGYYDGKTWVNAIHPVEWQEIRHKP